MGPNGTSEWASGSTSFSGAASPPRRARPIDLTGESSSDGSPEVVLIRKPAQVAPRYVARADQQPRALAGPSQQYRQQQLPFKPLPVLQNTDPRFNRTPPESPTSYNNRQNAINALKNNPPPRPFASTAAAFTTISAKQNAINEMQVRSFLTPTPFIHHSNSSSPRPRLATPSSDYPR